MLCSSKAQQQAECPWITSPYTLSSSSFFSFLTLSFSLHLCLMDVSVSPGPLLKEPFQNHYTDTRFLQLCSLQQVVLLFLWCFGACLRKCVCEPQLATCGAMVTCWGGKWGWPRLDSNNYLGHVCPSCYHCWFSFIRLHVCRAHTHTQSWLNTCTGFHEDTEQHNVLLVRDSHSFD